MSGTLLAVVLMGLLGWAFIAFLIIRALIELAVRWWRKRHPIETDAEMYERLKQYGHSDF